MTCTAIIVTYNTPRSLLRRCLNSLAQNGLDKNQVIVRDNTVHNIGFAAGVNQAALGAQSDLLLFLNPDAAMSPASLSLAIDRIAQHPETGLVGLLLISPNGQPEIHSFGPPVTPLSLFTRHLAKASVPTQPTAVGWVSGGAMLIRRSLFQRLRGFDSRFFLYWEDIDLCRRARNLGFQVELLPGARVVHNRGASLGDQKLKTKLFDASADKYFRKYYPKPICSILRLSRTIYRKLSPQVL